MRAVSPLPLVLPFLPPLSLPFPLPFHEGWYVRGLVPRVPPPLALPAGAWHGPASLRGTPAAPRGRLGGAVEAQGRLLLPLGHVSLVSRDQCALVLRDELEVLG